MPHLLKYQIFSPAIPMRIFSSVQLYLPPDYVYNLTAVSPFKNTFLCFYSSSILLFSKTTHLSFIIVPLSHHSEYFAKSYWCPLYNMSFKNKQVLSLTPCGWNLSLSSDSLSSQVPKLLLPPLLLFLTPTWYSHSCYKPFPQKHSLSQTINHLTSFLHPSKQIFPVLLILFFLILPIFLSILCSIVFTLPIWLHSGTGNAKSPPSPCSKLPMSPSQNISTPKISLFYIHSSRNILLPKKSWVWVFLNQIIGTSTHSFLHSLCDRFTLELHSELNTVISSLMQLIYYIKVLLHSKFSHAEILSSFWQFTENMYVFSSHNIGCLFLVKAK